MTRINLVDPKTLSGKHLIAEYRELPRVLGLVRQRLNKLQDFEDIPAKYTMGPGHVKFFYNKLGFLRERYSLIVKEMANRGYFVSYGQLDIESFPEHLCQTWIPNPEDIEISKQRILERTK